MKRSTALLGLGAVGLVGLRRARVRPMRLAGRVALVTGGSRGLGLAIARALGRRGARVVICGRVAEDLGAARAELAAQGVPALALVCDVTQPLEVARLVADVRQVLGPIDLVFNNAGTMQVGPIETMTRGDFEEALGIYLWGPLNVIGATAPSMQRRRTGRIVNIASIGGKVAVPHLLPYSCAKFALVGLSEGLRAELAKDGVRVTTVVPGLMRTGSALNARFKGDAAGELAWFAAGDVTPLTAMSASRAARRIVAAAARGEAEVTLSWQAKLVRTLHAIAPGLTIDLLGLLNRLLPRAGGHAGARGRELPRIAGLVGRLLEREAALYNQV
jgi:NAD(P)-dependent dehydrogenase (short-subunit alcohol dehydrogenase family)